MAETLLKKCEGCDWCPFEIILLPQQRKKEVLDRPLSRRHPHREIIEQICGRRYDEVCEMKYAAMRADLSDFDLAQMGAVVKNFCWDYGKKVGRKVEGNEGFLVWTKDHDIGRGLNESYALRFREIWNLGLRKFPGEEEPYQTLSEITIYEVVVSEDYDLQIKALEKRKLEATQREEEGLIR